MVRIGALTIAITLAAASFGSAAAASGGSETTITSTGWFSDISCAAPRVARGDIGPNNPDCIKRCLDEGKTPVFVDEQARAFYEVKSYPSVKEDLGWHIELTGTVDADRKFITVQSVKRLEYSGPQCGLKKKTATKTDAK
jgi:hypothetical protein